MNLHDEIPIEKVKFAANTAYWGEKQKEAQ